jgi:hypothetical protein
MLGVGCRETKYLSRSYLNKLSQTLVIITSCSVRLVLSLITQFIKTIIQKWTIGKRGRRLEVIDRRLYWKFSTENKLSLWGKSD